MTRNAPRLGVGLTFAIAGIAALVPMSGCESGGGLGSLLGTSSAMDLLTPVVRGAADSYIGNLSSLTSSLGSLDNLQAVMDFVERVEPTVRELSSSYQTLAGTTGEERSNLLEAFGPKISSVNSGFLSQTDALKGNSMWGRALAPVLDQIQLFQ